MDITIRALNYGFSVGITNVLCVVGGVVIMFFFDRWVLGRQARKDLKALKCQVRNLQAINIASEARLSVLERIPRSGGSSLAYDEINTLSGRGSSSVESKTETRAIWLASPGAGRTAAKLLINASTLEEARDIYSGFRAASQKSDAQWANWAFLYRLEEEGCGHEVFDVAFTLAEEDQKIIGDEEIWKTVLSWREETPINGN